MTPISLNLARQISEKAKEKGIELPVPYYAWDIDKEELYRVYLSVPCGCVEAFTTDELMEILPKHIDNYTLEITWTRPSELVDVGYFEMFTSECLNPIINEQDPSPAEALGLLLLWCLKEGYVK